MKRDKYRERMRQNGEKLGIKGTEHKCGLLFKIQYTKYLPHGKSLLQGTHALRRQVEDKNNATQLSQTMAEIQLASSLWLILISY